MNVGIRRVGIAVTALLLLLVAQLTYLQVFDAKHLAHDPRNSRDTLKDLRSPRGSIVSADDKVLATSVPSHDEFKLARTYPLGALVSQIVGYQSIVVGNSGLEKTYNDVLAGRGSFKLGVRDVVRDFLRGTKRVGNLRTSLRVDVQLVAKEALGEQKGSVVVIEPSTGAIVAMYSNPTYDPQPLAGHDTRKVQAYFDLLNNAPDKPSLARAFREIYPPGSTFKVVTATAALDTNKVALDTKFPSRTELPVPQTNNTISNFGRHSCGGDLTAVFTESCNTAFGALGLALGNDFPPAMQKFGIYDPPPLDVSPGAVASTGPAFGSFDTAKPRFALAGIGQGDVATTPLQMALVASAIANGGMIMQPHVGTVVLDDEGKRLADIPQRPWRRATSPGTAAILTNLMINVVQHGTGTAAQIPGITVAGKTGTAQTTPDVPPHAWFVAFAPAEKPQYAIAVIVERGGNRGGDATGGHLAAPIAAKILRYLLVH